MAGRRTAHVFPLLCTYSDASQGSSSSLGISCRRNNGTGYATDANFVRVTGLQKLVYWRATILGGAGDSGRDA